MKLNARNQIGIIGLMLLIGSFSVSAADISLQLDLSYEKPSGEVGDRYSSELGPNFSLEYMYNDYLGFRTSIAYHHYDRPGDGRDLSVLHGTISSQVAYPFLDQWRVYSYLGMGFYSWEADNAWWLDGQSNDSTDLGFNYGAGVSYKLFDFMDITSAVTRHAVKFKRNDTTFNWTEFTCGVRFLLDFSSQHHNI